jgi:RNA polymerase sigma-70 factor, ECF subfamily
VPESIFTDLHSLGDRLTKNRSGLSKPKQNHFSEDGFVTDPVVKQGESEGRTSLSLLERVQEHDRASWERFVALYGPMVYGWCIRAHLQPADAADVGQEVFASVARSIGGFRHDRPGDSFRGWLFTITRNKIRDRPKRPGADGIGGSDAQQTLAQLPAESLDEADSISDSGPVSEKKLLCRRAMELLQVEFEPRTWEAFWRSFVEMQAPADIASDLGMSVNAVYLAKSRILRRLREEYAALVDLALAK